MNRNLWTPKSFDKVNKYPCPKCNMGILKGISKISELTKEGKEMLGYKYPYGVSNIFCGILKCSNNKCDKLISVIGELLTDIETETEDHNGEYYILNLKRFIPKYFYPNLRFFPLSKEIPENITTLIDESFALYFSDNNSCANKIRTTIENILDDLKAPKRKWIKTKNKYVKLNTLHSRIIHFSKTKPKISKLMMALKIIGNEGSHTTSCNEQNLLDAFEILESLVENIYVKNSDRIEMLAESKL